jgi:hypothetical protein
VHEIFLKTTPAKEHVPEVERCIWLIKERVWGILNTLLFKKMPQVMLIELIYHVVLWLNAFPTKTGVGKDLLHCKIVICQKNDLQSTVKLFLARTVKYMTSLLRQT